jgi:hypothetical protein
MDKGPQFYHGSNHSFEPGDIVSPQKLSKDKEKGSGWAFATPDKDYAAEHGKYVYVVESLGDEAPHPDNEEAIVSKKGFRVVKRHGHEG